MFKNPYPHYPPCFSGNCTDRPCCARGFRHSWPEMVGTDADAAMSFINQTNPLVTVVKVPKGQMVYADFCCNRIFLYVGPDNKVASLPRVG